MKRLILGSLLLTFSHLFGQTSPNPSTISTQEASTYTASQIVDAVQNVYQNQTNWFNNANANAGNSFSSFFAANGGSGYSVVSQSLTNGLVIQNYNGMVPLTFTSPSGTTLSENIIASFPPDALIQAIGTLESSNSLPIQFASDLLQNIPSKTWASFTSADIQTIQTLNTAVPLTSDQIGKLNPSALAQAIGGLAAQKNPPIQVISDLLNNMPSTPWQYFTSKDIQTIQTLNPAVPLTSDQIEKLNPSALAQAIGDLAAQKNPPIQVISEVLNKMPSTNWQYFTSKEIQPLANQVQNLPATTVAWAAYNLFSSNKDLAGMLYKKLSVNQINEAYGVLVNEGTNRSRSAATKLMASFFKFQLPSLYNQNTQNQYNSPTIPASTDKTTLSPYASPAAPAIHYDVQDQIHNDVQEQIKSEEPISL